MAQFFASDFFKSQFWATNFWAETAVQTTTSTGAGRGTRKRYILPDGTNVIATLQDVQDMLEQFIVPDTRPQKRAAMAKALSVRKGSEPKLDLVQFQPIKSDVVKVKLEAPWVLDTKSAAYKKALKQIEFDEEEETMVLLLMTLH